MLLITSLLQKKVIVILVFNFSTQRSAKIHLFNFKLKQTKAGSKKNNVTNT